MHKNKDKQKVFAKQAAAMVSRIVSKEIKEKKRAYD
jgi:hypothetical protein